MVDIPIPSGNYQQQGAPLQQNTDVYIPPVVNVPVPPPPSGKSLPLPILVGVGVTILMFIILVTIRGLMSNKNKKVELTLWGFWEQSVVDPLIQDYQKQNPDVTVKYVLESKVDYRERLTNTLAKPNGPDIFPIHNSWVPMFNKELDSLPQAVMTQADYAKTFYPIASSDLSNSRSIVGIPLEYDALTLFINEDIFASSGKTPPSTWDDLRVLAKDPALLKKDLQGNITQAGVALGRTENVDYWPEIIGLMMLQSGVDLNNPSGDAAQRALKFYALFSTVEGDWDVTQPVSSLAFSNGKLAMYFAPSWEAYNIKSLNPGLKFRTVALPQLARSNPSDPGMSYATYWADGVWARSKNKMEAWKFLKFLSSQESETKLNAPTSGSFAKAYSRMDMADAQKQDPYLGSVVSLAPYAQSWYLQSNTHDGPTGINTQIKNLFSDAVTSTIKGLSSDTVLSTLNDGLNRILSAYGLVK
ncbi:extracellular solute-binding protein [Candidatus Woesebacteria bacterium]|nr:extracellular solute-binding protein [Candidatus Woesebacteria bacterium]